MSVCLRLRSSLPCRTVTHEPPFVRVFIARCGNGFYRERQRRDGFRRGAAKKHDAACRRNLLGTARAYGCRTYPIPRLHFQESRCSRQAELVKERYDHESGGKDLDPEAERLISRWAKEEHDSDFVFVTHYPQAARPFYTYPTEDGLDTWS